MTTASAEETVELKQEQKVCRICLLEAKILINLFTKDIVEKIKFCTDVEFSEKEEFPSHMCNQCYQDLSTARRFKENCQIADYKFQIKKCIEFYNPSLKQEHCVNKGIETGYIRELKQEIESEEDNSYELNNDIFTSLPLNNASKNKIESSGKINKILDEKEKKRRSRRLYCTICEIKFDTKQESDLHKKKNHKQRYKRRIAFQQSNKKQNVCQVCGRNFEYASSYAGHMQSHNPNLRYHCNDCDYKTWGKSDLVKHVLIHLGIKKHQCKICSRLFRLKCHLICHMRRVHEKRASKYTCEICGKRFKEKTILAKHISTHSGIRGFKCEECFKDFVSRRNWKRHLLTLHNIKIPPLKSGRRRQEQ